METDRNREWLLRVVAEASTLEERVYGPLDAVEEGNREGDERIARWRLRVADGNARRFERRIRAEGWSTDRVRAAVGAVRLRAGTPLPGWADVVDAWIRRCASASISAPAPESTSSSPTSTSTSTSTSAAASTSGEHGWPARGEQPAAAIFLPLVEIARERLDASPHVRLLGDGARAALGRGLLARLRRACEPALAAELAAFGAVHGAPGEDAFVAHLRAGGLAALLGRAPALARLAGTMVEDWTAATAEMLERLAADRRRIRAVLGGGRALGRVRRIEGGLSDPHRRGRTVAVVEFQSGCTVVYKPRGLAVDAAWHRLLAWLAARGAGPALRAPVVIDHGTHGWAEHIRPAPCAGEGELAGFGERAGALLALAYALGAADLHAENVVACGADPVLVDVEMLLSTPPGRRRRAAAEGTPESAHAASVLRPALLPAWVPGPGGAARRDGGFAARTSAAGEGGGPRVANLPWMEGDGARRDPDLAAVEAGFTAMYRALVRVRDELLARDGPLAAFAGAEVRVVLRATWVYDALLRRTLHPRFAASGADRWIELDALARTLLAPDPPPTSWRALAAERADLARGDVPHFVTRAGELAVRDSAGREVGVPRRRSGLAEAAARLRSLGEADLAVQRRIIRLAYDDPPAPPAGRAPSTVHTTPADGAGRADDAGGGMGREELAAEAVRIGERLVRTACRGSGGAVDWIAPGTASGRAGFAFAGDGFAHGRAGIACFLAACHAATGDPAFRDTALAALAPLVRRLRGRGAARRLAAEHGIGAENGVGGIVYGLARTAALLGDAGLLRAAGAAAAALRPRRGGDDDAIGIARGTAGAALGLLALHAVGGEGDALAWAAESGGRLRERVASIRPRAPGFAHGAAGVAHAFLRIHRATGDPRFRGDAEGAFESGRARAAPAKLAGAWCHGAVGVGLARAAALDLTGTPRGVDAAVRAAERHRPGACDTACCGSLGTVELLLVAAERAARPAPRGRAEALAARVVRRAWARRSYGTVVEDRYAPGFFQGAAGIGYGLLRLSDPARFPSVLLWE